MLYLEREAPEENYSSDEEAEEEARGNKVEDAAEDSNYLEDSM